MGPVVCGASGLFSIGMALLVCNSLLTGPDLFGAYGSGAGVLSWSWLGLGSFGSFAWPAITASPAMECG